MGSQRPQEAANRGEADVSELTRSGIIGSAITTQMLQGEGGAQVPFCFFDIHSVIDIGTERIEETAKVLLLGKGMCDPFLAQNPQQGDKVVVANATAYVRDGVLCLRPEAAVKVRVTQKPATRGETFGIPEADFIKAMDYFK